MTKSWARCPARRVRSAAGQMVASRGSPAASGGHDTPTTVLRGLTWFAARQRVEGLRRTPSQTGATLLTLTDQAQTAVRTMTQDPQARESAGLRSGLGRSR